MSRWDEDERRAASTASSSWARDEPRARTRDVPGRELDRAWRIKDEAEAGYVRGPSTATGGASGGGGSGGGGLPAVLRAEAAMAATPAGAHAVREGEDVKRELHARHRSRSRSRERDRERDAGGGAASLRRDEEGGAPKPKKEVQAPNYGLSGALAAATTKAKYAEPMEARMPTQKWRLQVFKGEEQQDAPLYMHRQTAYLFGRDAALVDVPILHPSCSSQHAVLQYRAVPSREGGPLTVRPYLIDLESTNGTRLNGKRLEPARYYELRPLDVIQFGLSTREYVIMHEDML